jgi:hypothetical protein
MMGIRKNPDERDRSRQKPSLQSAERSKEPRSIEREVYFLSPAMPKDIKMYINKIFLSIQQGKRVVLLGITPKDFLIKLLTKYSGGERNRDTDNKINNIIEELFSHYKIKKIVTLKEQGVDLTPDNIQKISNFVNNLFDYINNQETDSILVPENRMEFSSQMIVIHNNILKESNFDKNLSKLIKTLRKKTRNIIDFYGIGKAKSQKEINV